MEYEYKEFKISEGKVIHIAYGTPLPAKMCHVSIIPENNDNEIICDSPSPSPSPIVVYRDIDGKYKYQPYHVFKKYDNLMTDICKDIMDAYLPCGQKNSGNYKYHFKERRETFACSFSIRIGENLFSAVTTKIDDTQFYTSYNNYSFFTSVLDGVGINRREIDTKLEEMYQHAPSIHIVHEKSLPARMCYVSIIPENKDNKIICDSPIVVYRDIDGKYKYQPYHVFKKYNDLMTDICKDILDAYPPCGQKRSGNYKYHVERCRDTFVCVFSVRIGENLFSAVTIKFADTQFYTSYNNYRFFNSVLNSFAINRNDIDTKLKKMYLDEEEKKYSVPSDPDKIILAVSLSADRTPGIYHAKLMYKSERTSDSDIKITYHIDDSIELSCNDPQIKVTDANLRMYITNALQNEFSQSTLDKKYFIKENTTTKQPREEKEKTRMGRIKNAESFIPEEIDNCDLRQKYAKSALMCYRKNQLLREVYSLKSEKAGDEEKWYINKLAKRKTNKLRYLNDISLSSLEVLSWLNDLKYVHKESLIDLIESGIIDWGNNVKVDSALKKMSSYGLIDELKFVSIDSSINENNESSESSESKDKTFVPLTDKPTTTTIYALGEAGARLLKDTGRLGQYNPFDRFQDGNVVKARLTANQWLVYWLYAYPEVFKEQYYPARVLYVSSLIRSGARFHASVECKDTLIVGEPLRRTDEHQKERFKKELINKFERFMTILDPENTENVFCSSDSVYIPKKNIICYICEDEAHIEEVYGILKDKMKEYPGQKIWFTTDLKTHNYDQKGKRFIVFDEKDSSGFVDLNKELGLGEERASWDPTVCPKASAPTDKNK